MISEDPKVEISSGAVVLWRCKILLVFQARTKTWSFPKGHLEHGEEHLEAAQREVEEESGLKALGVAESLGRYTRPTRRQAGVMKQIDLFLFLSDSGDVTPKAKDVTICRWFSIDEALEVLSYGEERRFLEEHRARIERRFV